MIKTVIITHGNLGEELIRVSEKIMGQSTDIQCLSFDWEEDGSKTVNKLEDFLKKNKKDDIIIFTDMFGGSPSNICLKYLDRNVEVITGINLPGLLRYLTHRDKGLKFKELVQRIKQGTIDGINVLGEYLGEKKK
jgi:PTS system mannose-specific IIA component